MEYVGTIRLGGTPLPNFGSTTNKLAEEPYEPKANKYAHQRLVDAKPLPNKGVPCATVAKIIAYGQAYANEQNGKAYAITHLF